MENPTTRVCQACNKALKGRSDKKFCDDYCRNNFNNQQRAVDTNYARHIIQIIRKNRAILSSFLGNEEMTKTTKDRLLEKGFQFKYHTHHYENKKGNVYVFCFEYGYLPLDHDWFLIVKRNPES
jgi:predicted nucleic acid-binding Zn ribbon protein